MSSQVVYVVLRTERYPYCSDEVSFRGVFGSVEGAIDYVRSRKDVQEKGHVTEFGYNLGYSISYDIEEETVK